MIFGLAIIIGIYSYFLFALGVLGLFYQTNIILFTFLYVLIFWGLFKDKLRFTTVPKFNIFLFIIILQSFINLVGALGPELGFDALWYHLTIPKIYLSSHVVSHIPGGLLYYSDMPKLTEMLYSFGLSLGSEFYAKIIHFLFGILILFSLYSISRRFLNKSFSFLVVLIFSSNLVFSWQSTTAYIDLARTFFELLAFWAFLNFYKNKKNTWLLESAVMLGLAISTKLLALSSIPIFVLLIFLAQKNIKKSLFNSLIFFSISILIPSPWFLYSYLNTGNAFYPLLTHFYPISSSLTNPIIDFWNLFTHLYDPISPLYLIILPFVFMQYRKFKSESRLVCLYSVLGLFTWYIIPKTGGGRFILPYLPILSLLMVIVIKTLSINLRKISIVAVVLVSLITILYRGAANYKYISVLTGLETKEKFLSDNLNFSYGDFYDTDGYFRNHIKDSDRVLLFGFHNLFYTDFPFIDSSFVKKGDSFNYIAVQNSTIPERFKFWNLIYSNLKTGVKLYSLGGQKWTY